MDNLSRKELMEIIITKQKIIEALVNENDNLIEKIEELEDK